MEENSNQNKNIDNTIIENTQFKDKNSENESQNNLDVEEVEEIENTEFENELLQAFKEIDEDQSGTISKYEFGNFMRKLGYRPTLVELQEMIDEVDKDKSGQIGFDEFKLIMTRTIRDEFTINSSIEAFAVFDNNKTMKYKKDELLNILKTKGDHKYSESELIDLLKYVNFDDNEEIDYKEFILDTFNSLK